MTYSAERKKYLTDEEMGMEGPKLYAGKRHVSCYSSKRWNEFARAKREENTEVNVRVCCVVKL